MRATFDVVPMDEIPPDVRRHLAARPGRIDAFLEEHILGSEALRIVVDGAPAGIAAIHGESLITCFAPEPRVLQHGQAMYHALRPTGQVAAAFVPTCDEVFLAHALDDMRELRKQAYFFALGLDVPPVADGWTPAPATADDAAFIREVSGDFSEPVERRIETGELFLMLGSDERVGVGNMERSTLYDAVASIGMLAVEQSRRGGVGAATIGMLVRGCQRRGITPIAGCWYYNHRSKRTLERAGLVATTRLLRIES